MLKYLEIKINKILFEIEINYLYYINITILFFKYWIFINTYVWIFGTTDIFHIQIAECGIGFSKGIKIDENPNSYFQASIKRQNEKILGEHIYESTKIKKFEYDNTNSENFIKDKAFKSKFIGNTVEQQPFDDTLKIKEDLDICNKLDNINKEILRKNLIITANEKITDILANDSNNCFSNGKNEEYFIYDSIKKN